jgi:carbonic anhydrase
MNTKTALIIAAATLLTTGVATAEPDHGHAPAPAKTAPKPEPGKPAPAARPAPSPKPIKAPPPSATPEDHHPKHEPKQEGDAPAAAPAIRQETAREPARDATRPKQAPVASAPQNAEEALDALTQGNLRWAADKAEHPSADNARRTDTGTNGQKPFATILTCSDSRLPVERLFDRGVGELFVVRVAGNVAGGSESGTIEYATEHLKTPLLVVLGHTQCGAVAAAATGAKLHGALGALVERINPAVERASRANPGVTGKDLAPLAVKENVWQSVFDLMRSSPEVRSLVKAGKLRVVGALYDVKTGKVEWMGDHPWQSELISAMDARDERRQADAQGGEPGGGSAHR